MSSKSFIIFLAVVLAACSGKLVPSSTPSAEQMNVEQQAVYAALLQKLYSASSYVIMDTTATGPSGVGDTASSLDYIVKNMRSIDLDTVDNFRVRNEAGYPVPPDMDLGSGYVLMSKDKMSRIFSLNQDGWQVFYDQHPDAPGITTLSQVGFNKAFDQALVYVGTMSHWLAGGGYYVLLIKVNGSWVVDQQVMTWIS